MKCNSRSSINVDMHTLADADKPTRVCHAASIHQSDSMFAINAQCRHVIPLPMLCSRPCPACALSSCASWFLCVAARLNLPIKWLPDRIAEQNFNLEEPPTKASAWVGALLNNHLKVFRERLSTMPMLSPSDVDQVWLPLFAQQCESDVWHTHHSVAGLPHWKHAHPQRPPSPTPSVPIPPLPPAPCPRTPTCCLPDLLTAYE